MDMASLTAMCRDFQVWNPYVEKLILPLHGHNSSLCGVTIVPGTPQIITADTEGTFKLWDIRNFSCVQTFSSDDVDSLNSFVSVTKHRRLVSGGKRVRCDCMVACRAASVNVLTSRGLRYAAAHV